MKKDREDVVKAIRLAWDSLDSHLDSSQDMSGLSECCQKSIGKPSFHKKCCEEYAFVIKVLASFL